MPRPRVFSGIQPTADSFHLGNYLGALRHWVDLQDTHETIYCVVDLHAITVAHQPAALGRRTLAAAAQLIAMGVDPDRSTVFVQSHVPEHAELAWVLGCLTGYGEAGRMTQFKDKSGKQQTTSVGLFTYPILQAADILAHQADAVPVGEDQRQHLELSRTLAERFNHRFGPTFTVPQPHIVRQTAKIFDLQEPPAKMSKSSSSPQGIIDLLDPPDDIRRKIRRAVTDSGSEIAFDVEVKPGVANLLVIQSALSGVPVPTLVERYAGQGYGALKAEVAETVVAAITPIRERYEAIIGDPEGLQATLAQGAQRARRVAAATMATVRERVGFLPAKG